MYQKVNGRNSNIIKWVIALLGLGGSIIFTFYSFQVEMAQINRNELALLASQFTTDYQIRQIIVSLLMFVIGYLIVSCANLDCSEAMKTALSVPTAAAVWGTVSIVVLLLRIPYTSITMTIITGIITGICLYLKRDSIRNIGLHSLGRKIVIVLALSNIFSTGMIRYFMSSDSYMFIMEYGEIIAHEGHLSFESVGGYMVHTGISTALLSSLAYFAGFESIVVIHFLLIASLLLGMGAYIYSKLNFISKIPAAMLSLVVVVSSMFIAPFYQMAYWIISNTWFMVFLFFFLVLFENYIKESYKSLKGGFYILMSIFVIWMTFSRIEGCVTMCFILICIGYTSISKKNYFIISAPMVLFQGIYLAKVFYERSKSEKWVPTGFDELTIMVVGIMAISLVFIVVYGILFETAFLKKIRKYLPHWILGGIFLLIIIMAVIFPDRAVLNAHVMLDNLVNSNWGYFPHFFVLFLICIFKNLRKIGYWEMIVFGYPLFQFALCMGRHNPLRIGYGDSYNRILMSFIPICIIYIFNYVVVTYKKLNV